MGRDKLGHDAVRKKERAPKSARVDKCSSEGRVESYLVYLAKEEAGLEISEKIKQKP